LRTRHIAQAGDLDLLAGIDAEAPRGGAIAVEHCARDHYAGGDPAHDQEFLQPISRLLGQRRAPDGDALLSAQERRLRIVFDVHIVEARVERIVVCILGIFGAEGCGSSASLRCVTLGGEVIVESRHQMSVERSPLEL